MGKWDKASKKAAAKVDQDAEADGLDDLFAGVRGALKRIDDPDERKRAVELIEEIQAETSRNARKQAIADFRASVGAATYRLIAKAAKGTIKAMFAALLCLVWSAPAEAAKLDIMPLVENLSVCTIYTDSGDLKLGGCYAPVTWGWGGLNGGVVWDTNGADKSIGGGFAAVSFRADLAWSWAWERMDLAKRGFKIHFAVPSVEIGPMGGYMQHEGWVYGGFLSGKWPFGGYDVKE